VSKNYSIKEHISLIKRKYQYTKNFIEVLDFNKDYTDNTSIEKIISYFIKNEINFLILNASILKSEGFIDIKEPAILTTMSGDFIKNNDTGILKKYNNHLIYKYNKSETELLFDTSILDKFYLNDKTINHFSMIILTEDNSFYYMKRSNNRFLFS